MKKKTASQLRYSLETLEDQLNFLRDEKQKKIKKTYLLKDLCEGHRLNSYCISDYIEIAKVSYQYLKPDDFERIIDYFLKKPTSIDDCLRLIKEIPQIPNLLQKSIFDTVIAKINAGGITSDSIKDLIKTYQSVYNKNNNQNSLKIIELFTQLKQANIIKRMPNGINLDNTIAQESLNYKNAITESIKELLDSYKSDVKIDRKTLKKILNEAYFSDFLAFLLESNSSHEKDNSFTKKFINKVAEIRTKGVPHRYDDRGSFLRWGKTNCKGTHSSELHLGNASILREFHLSKKFTSPGKKGKIKSLFFDIVLMDLDPNDHIFVTVENKLFTQNHEDQLENYFEAVSDKLKIKIREFIYLTLKGDNPNGLSFDKGKVVAKQTKLKNWVCLSWLTDVLPLIDDSILDKCNQDQKSFVELLKWIKNNNEQTQLKTIATMKDRMIEASSDMLLEELQRLQKDQDKTYWIKSPKSNIYFDGNAKRELTLSYKSSFFVSIESKDKKFQSIKIPYGISAHQLCNFHKLAAQTIYKQEPFKNVNTKAYKQKKGKIVDEKLISESLYSELFKFVYENKNFLQLIFSLSNQNSNNEEEN